MTHQQMADLVHMHRSNYSKVESGERELSLESIDISARYFEMTIDELIRAGLTSRTRACSNRSSSSRNSIRRSAPWSSR